MRQLQRYLLPFLTALSLIGGPVLAEDISAPPTVTPSARAFQIESINRTGLDLLLRINNRSYVLLPTTQLQWEGGSAASRDALKPGTRVRIRSRMQTGDLAVIEQLTIMAD